MLNDEHFKVVDYWERSSDVFDNVSIKGGVAITMWNKAEQYDKIGTFILQEDLNAIKNRVWSIAKENFCNNVYSRDLYQLNQNFYTENPQLKNRQSAGHKYDVGTTIFTLFPEIFSETNPGDGYALIIGRENNTRIAKWMRSDYLKLPDNFVSYKVFIPTANGSGKFGEALGNPIIGEPRHGHNTTFLSIGRFVTNKETEACLKYIKTKFARTMLGIRKVTQHNTRQAWEFVPNQDFTSNSDIDWSKSIEDIDKQLYKKYGLTEHEIEFIETNIQPME